MEINWISFAEKIPKNNSYVEVRANNLWKGEGIFQDGKFVYSSIKGACFGEPTHWRLKERLPVDEKIESE